MYRCGPRALVTLILVLVLSYPLQSASAIGMAVADGGFQIDGSPVSGNTTIFEGSVLETGNVASELQLEAGQRLVLASGSRGQIFRDHMVLEKGVSEVTGGSEYRVEARGLRVAPQVSGAAARVMVEGERRLRVAALSGTFRVMTVTGRTVALLEPGMALVFEPQAPGQLPEFTMTGCMERRGSQYVIRDLVAGVLEEVRGSGLDRYVGDVVEVTGRDLPNVKPVTGADEVIQIISIRRVSGGCPAPPAPAKLPAAVPAAPPAAPPEGAAAPAPSAGGMSGAAKAVIAGVVIGGAGAGAAIYLTQKKDSGTISR